MTHPCSFCGGAAHPATGCQYSATCIACWRCTIETWRWVKGHTNRKQGRKHVQTAKTFYEVAGEKP